MKIRKFNPSDSEEVSKLVCRNLLEINSKDYGIEEMLTFAKEYNSDKILKIATDGNMYIATENKQIIGCGAISYINPQKTESIILTLFVLPEYHKKGIGKKILEALKKDPVFIQSYKIIVHASLSSNHFYEKMGFSYKSNLKKTSPQKYYHMEKILK